MNRNLDHRQTPTPRQQLQVVRKKHVHIFGGNRKKSCKINFRIFFSVPFLGQSKSNRAFVCVRLLLGVNANWEPFDVAYITILRRDVTDYTLSEIMILTLYCKATVLLLFDLRRYVEIWSQNVTYVTSSRRGIYRE